MELVMITIGLITYMLSIIAIVVGVSFYGVHLWEGVWVRFEGMPRFWRGSLLFIAWLAVLALLIYPYYHVHVAATGVL